MGIFGKKEVEVANPQKTRAIQLSNLIWDARNTLEKNIKKAYVINASLICYLPDSADYLYELKELEEIQIKIRNNIAHYEDTVKIYSDYVNKHDLSSMMVMPPLSSHEVIRQITAEIHRVSNY